MSSQENYEAHDAETPRQEATGGEQPSPPPAQPPPPPQSAPQSSGWRSGAQPQYGFDPREKNAALACFLSLMPGLGQVYVGYYQRGFMHILIVGSVIAILAESPVDELIPLFGIFLPFFWLYNIIDAGRRAGLYNHALRGGAGVELPLDAIPGTSGSVFGGAVLIGAGLLMLMYTRYGMSMRWIEEWWPVAPIAFGVWLVLQGLSKTRK